MQQFSDGFKSSSGHQTHQKRSSSKFVCYVDQAFALSTYPLDTCNKIVINMLSILL